MIEAVVKELPVKQKLLLRLDGLVGMHFFYLVALMKLVEVVS